MEEPTRRKPIEEALNRPALRPVQPQEGELEGRPCVVLQDPSGVSPRAAVLTHSALAVVSLFDGIRDLREIQADLMRTYGELVPLEVIEELARQLDGCLLLESPAFHAFLEEQLEAYRSQPVRPASMAGDTYPADPEDLRDVLDAYSLSEKSPGRPVGQKPGRSVFQAVIAPHIDFARGGPLYAASYREIEERSLNTELFIILGIDHRGPTDDQYILTELDYDTPLGPVRTHTEAAAFVVERMGEEIKHGELSHAREHSIEFQAVWLRHVLGERQPRALFVLCGSFARFIEEDRSPGTDPVVQRFTDTLRQLRRRHRCCIIAGVDLAHVGPAFQDPEPLRADRLLALRQADGALLDRVAEASPDGVFEMVRRERDRRKICGLPAIYTMLSALDPSTKGTLLAYDQCPADPDNTSWVTACAMSFSGPPAEPQGDA